MARSARWALIAGVLVVVGLFVLEMSGSAQRLAFTNDVASASLLGHVRPGQRLCQPEVIVPSDGATVRMFVASFDRPLPTLHVTIANAAGRVVDRGDLPGGGTQGWVNIPLKNPRPVAGRLCLTVDEHRVVVGGTAYPIAANSQTLDGRQQPAVLSIAVMRSGSETWWHLLPAVIRRVGYGRSPSIGVAAFVLALLAVALIWLLSVRLLWKEGSSS